MNILVTGGAGYVGSHCVKALCAAGHSVTVIDDLSTGHRTAVDKAARLVEGCLGDETLLSRVFQEGDFHAVMHFAASAEVNESVRDPLKYYRNNVINTIGLLEACRTGEVKTLVFSSSCAVFGVPPSVPITEDMPRVPISPYGRTKLAIEWAMQDCATAWGLSGTALRYFNAAGAAGDGTIGEDHDPETHLIPRVLQVALEKEFFVLDSRTTDKTRIPALSDELGITCVNRTIFLDEVKNLHHAKKQLLKLGQEALKTGKAVGIGHVGQGGKITARALQEMIPGMEEMGIELDRKSVV